MNQQQQSQIAALNQENKEIAAKLQARDSEIAQLKQENQSGQQELTQARGQISAKEKLINEKTEQIKAAQRESE